MAYLELRNIVKSYDGVTRAVDNVNIDVQRGEFITFLGPSGSGKTTTLMMIAGFEEPTSGSIQLDGHEMTSFPPYKRNVGMVFQNYALFPHMTVSRNVGFPLRMRNHPKEDIERRVTEMLRLVGLQDFAHKHPKELSGGQQQRVALARGMVFNPDILLLDEPLGALDKNLREQMQVELKRIHKEVGITMIYVTHDQTEAMTMSDRVAVFSQGKIEQLGNPLDLYEKPINRFVGEFIGDSNFFHGRLNSACGTKAMVEGLGEIRLGHDPGSGAARNGAVDIMVRPERIHIVDGATDGLNVLDVAIDTLVHYGESVLAIGATSTGVPLRLRLTGRDVRRLKEGETVRVGWSPEDTHLVPSGSGGPTS